MDVDGTLTDGKIHIGNNGEMFKSFCVKDGMGIKLLQKHGIVIALITGRKSVIVENRAKELGISELYQGVDDKLAVINELSKKYAIPLSSMAYAGDDINDIDIMKAVGHSFCPKDSVAEVIAIADTVLTQPGGNGAIRQAAEIILRH